MASKTQKNYDKDNAPKVDATGAEITDVPWTDVPAEEIAPPCCKYAGDPEDDNCQNCNGVQIKLDGKMCDATECEGYEEGTPPDDWNAFYEEKNKPALKSSPESKRMPEKTLEKSTVVSVDAEAQTTEIRAEIAVTQEVTGPDGNKTWVKAGMCETRKVPEGAVLQDEREAIWADLQAEVTTQLDETLGVLGV